MYIQVKNNAYNMDQFWNWHFNKENQLKIKKKKYGSMGGTDDEITKINCLKKKSKSKAQ